MAITVKSDFWGNSYSFIRSKSSLRKVIARLLNQKENRVDRELLLTLNGVAPGATALETLKRVAADRLENGGKRTIETETLINRATTAADVTDLNTSLLAYTSRPTSYPVDKATRP